MIGFELEDKFEYPSHSLIGAPGAFTTAQLQDLTRYALERHVQRGLQPPRLLHHAGHGGAARCHRGSKEFMNESTRGW